MKRAGDMSNLRLHLVEEFDCPLLGPSLCVWVQGCPRRCPGCFNEAALDPQQDCLVMSVEEVVTIWKDHGGNLILSGGEPMDQAKALAGLCRRVRAENPAVEILSFTGYQLDEILDEKKPEHLEFLGLIDALIDGPFQQHNLSDDPLLGSKNQRLIGFNGRISKDRLFQARKPRVNLTISDQGKIKITGTASATHGMNALVETLRIHGIELGD